MTLSWDPDDARVVIEVFPFTEAAVVSPDQVDEDFEEPEPDELLLVRITPGAARAFVKRADPGARRRAARAARSAATRSTPRATCASARTASGDGTRDRPGRGPHRRGAGRSTAGSCRRRTRRSSARSTASRSSTSRSRGERPLWDFPDGTLAGREVAAYAVSEALGWNIVPQTFLRDGPHGPGMVQLWQEPDEEQAAVDIVAEGEVPEGWCHVFDGVDGQDHAGVAGPRGHPAAAADGGVRRAGQQRRPQGRARAGDARRAPVRRRPRRHLPHRPQAPDRPLGLARRAAHPGGGRGGRRGRATGSAADLGRTLGPLLSAFEIRALERRCGRLLARGVLPAPHGEWPAIPWPPF